MDSIIDAVSSNFYDAVPIEAYTYSFSLLESIILSSIASFTCILLSPPTQIN